MRKVILVIIVAGLLAGIFLFVTANNEVVVTAPEEAIQIFKETIKKVINPKVDIENQQPLANPPATIKAIYSTGWSGGSEKQINYFLDLIKNTELNAIVLDIKDYTGAISYHTDVPLVVKYGASENRIPKINKLIKRFHDEGIYVIGRMAVFQDQILVKARPDLALRSKATGGAWGDYKGVHWLDTASQEAWDYNADIAQDALNRGFDEINFDYIRFASDGNMADVVYPFFSTSTLKHATVKNFFKHIRERLPNAKLSADLFGYTTVLQNDLGIGQLIEDAFPYFDYIMPMTYPSHYNKGFLGYQNPANYPYEVLKYSMDWAITKLEAWYEKRTIDNEQLATGETGASSSLIVDRNLLINPKIRPWLQDFDLGADYDAVKVRAQIQAVYDSVVLASSSLPASDLKGGWALWNASNVYTKEALMVE